MSMSRNLVQRLQRSHRPWWLLLTLALFFAGQTLAAAHRHDEAKSLDSDCALCVYSSTSTAALGISSWHFAVVIAAVVFITLVASVRLSAERFCDSRAPPSSQN